jgi:hypothetical protein
VAFQSSATNLVPFDSNAAWDVFVHDRISGTTERVSIAPNGAQGNSHSEEPSLSDDGRFVAFRSQASNLVAGDTNGATDVFTRDRQTGITERSSVDSSGAEANSHSVDSTLSADGRCVVFYSLASNLIAVDGNDNLDVFVHDRASGTTERASVDMSGWEANSDSLWPAVSSDGRFVAFESLATNLVGGDTNGLRDIFVRDIFVRDRGAPPPVAYCTAGTTSSGCIAVMSSTGTPSVTATSGFTLSAGGVEGQTSGLIFYGISGRLAAPWGSGSSSFLCVKSPTQRMATQNTGGTDGACDGTLSEDWLAFVAAHPGALGAPFAAGQTVNAQGWFRDPPAAKTTSLSNGLEFTVGP